jgi:hypothetical protein
VGCTLTPLRGFDGDSTTAMVKLISGLLAIPGLKL